MHLRRVGCPEPLETGPHVDRDGDHAAAADVVAQQPEIPVWRDEAQNSLAVPLLVAYARVEGHVIEEARIDEGHIKVRHSSQLHCTVYIAVDLSRNCSAGLVDDRVHLKLASTSLPREKCQSGSPPL